MDKSKMMMVIIIALLVLLLGTVVGVGVYLINLSDDEGGWDIQQPPGVHDILMPEDLRTVSLETMTANLQLGPNNRSDNLVVEVVVGLNAHHTVDAEELEEFYGVFTRGIPVARAVAFDVFLNRTYEEVRTAEGRAETAEILTHALQEAFGSNLIVTVMFSEWNAVRGAERR